MQVYDIETAYDMLMSPSPYTHSSAAAMIRNFGTAATLMAQKLRENGAGGEGAGDSGAAMKSQSEAHAEWFDQVAGQSTATANQLDALAAQGNSHQATAQSVYSAWQAAVARDSGPNPSGSDDMGVIHMSQSGSQTLSAAVDQWGDGYKSFTPPPPPPVPASSSSTYGNSTGSSAGGDQYGAPVSGGGGRAPSASNGAHVEAVFVAPNTGVHGRPDGGPTKAQAAKPVIDRGPGVAGSIEVGHDGGEFAGWYKDPRTGFYVDPATGREYDPVSGRWIDPVTGLPFGAVTKYATSLEGAGGASTTAGLFADGGAGGGIGSLPRLFAAGPSGNPAAVADAYGGFLPPSLVSGSGASSSLWRQAGRSLGVRSAAASELLEREQAARAGRPYSPSSQFGKEGEGLAARGRPGYATAEEEESALFSSRARRGLDAEGLAEEEEEFAASRALSGTASRRAALTAEEAAEAERAGMTGRRPYMPSSQSGEKDEKGKGRKRPDWLVDDDVFAADETPAGVQD